MSTQAEIKTLFDLQSPNEANIVTECKLFSSLYSSLFLFLLLFNWYNLPTFLFVKVNSLCSLYSLTPDNLKNKWEAFALNSGCPLKPTSAYIKYLKNSLQREFERSLKVRRTVKGRVVTKRSTAMDLSEYGITTDSQENDADDLYVWIEVYGEKHWHLFI